MRRISLVTVDGWSLMARLAGGWQLAVDRPAINQQPRTTTPEAPLVPHHPKTRLTYFPPAEQLARSRGSRSPGVTAPGYNGAGQPWPQRGRLQQDRTARRPRRGRPTRPPSRSSRSERGSPSKGWRFPQTLLANPFRVFPATGGQACISLFALSPARNPVLPASTSCFQTGFAQKHLPIRIAG